MAAEERWAGGRERSLLVCNRRQMFTGHQGYFSCHGRRIEHAG